MQVEQIFLYRNGFGGQIMALNGGLNGASFLKLMAKSAQMEGVYARMSDVTPITNKNRIRKQAKN